MPNPFWDPRPKCINLRQIGNSMSIFSSKPNLNRLTENSKGRMIGRFYNKNLSSNRYIWVLGQEKNFISVDKDTFTHEFMSLSDALIKKFSVNPSYEVTIPKYSNHSHDDKSWALKKNLINFWCFIDSRDPRNLYLEKGGRGDDFALIGKLKIEKESPIVLRLLGICSDDHAIKTCLSATLVLDENSLEIKALGVGIPDELTAARALQGLVRLKFKS